MVSDTLTAALAVGPREVVGLVGGGGKTTALQLLAWELAAAGRSVVVTTTTAMFLRELAVVGPVFLGAPSALPAGALEDTVAAGRPCGLALREGEDDKVVGLAPEQVDQVWAQAGADYLLVEADGSRGKPLKAFAEYEPQLPQSSTLVVQVAGLDAVGKPLTGDWVHRAEGLAATLGLSLGCEVTAAIAAAAIREQTRVLRQLAPRARLVVMLNKTDEADEHAAGAVTAELLRGTRERTERPDAIVVTSLHDDRFERICVDGAAA